MRYGTEQILIFARHFFFITTVLVCAVVSASPQTTNTPASSQVKEAIELEDMALFRLSGQVFTLSDLKKIQQAFDIFKCVKGKSYLEVLLDVKPSEFTAFKITPESKDLGEDRIFKGFITLEKLKHFSVETARDYRGDVAAQNLIKDCRNIKWSELTLSERTLVLSEVYLRERYGTPKDLFKVLREFALNLNNQDYHEVLHLGPNERTQELLKKFENPTESSHDTSPENKDVKP